MKIVAISDCHGFLPEIPSCDLLLIAGDVTPSYNHHCGFQAMWLENTYKTWIESIDAKHICLVFGNHDLIGEHYPEETQKIFATFPKHFHYLQDSGVKIDGVYVWGSPWQITFPSREAGWAFNLDEPDLAKKWDLIPNTTDILLLHGPPYGYGDFSTYGNEHTGSPSLTKKIREIKPKLEVHGHIHAARSVNYISDTVAANVSVVNEKYKLVHKPMIFELDENGCQSVGENV